MDPHGTFFGTLKCLSSAKMDYRGGKGTQREL